MHLGATENEALKQGGASDDDIGLIENFKRRVAEFNQVFNALLSSGPPKDPALLNEYNSLISRGQTIRNTVGTVMDGINKAVTWAKATFGLNAINGGQLGWFWLIPVAGITATLAVIGKYISDAYMFGEKNKAFKDLTEKQKMTPQQAASVIQQTYGNGTGFFSKVGNIALPGVILVVSWLMLRN